MPATSGRGFFDGVDTPEQAIQQDTEEMQLYRDLISYRACQRQEQQAKKDKKELRNRIIEKYLELKQRFVPDDATQQQDQEGPQIISISPSLTPAHHSGEDCVDDRVYFSDGTQMHLREVERGKVDLKSFAGWIDSQLRAFTFEINTEWARKDDATISSIDTVENLEPETLTAAYEQEVSKPNVEDIDLELAYKIATLAMLLEVKQRLDSYIEYKLNTRLSVDVPQKSKKG